MNKRRAFIIAPLAMILFGLPIGVFVREYQQAKRDYALIDAVKAKDTARVTAALQSGADVNARDFSDQSLTVRAILQRLSEKLFHRENDNQVNSHPTILFHLLGSDCDRKENQDHCSPQAAEDPVLLALILDHGADVHMRGANEITPLILAAAHGFNASISLLIQHGSDINAQTKKGETSLMMAVAHGDPQTVKLLLDNHAAVNRKDKCGCTAFDYAFADQTGRTANVVLLWKAGAKTGKELDVRNPQ